jgi:hypothetical protein
MPLAFRYSAWCLAVLVAISSASAQALNFNGQDITINGTIVANSKGAEAVFDKAALDGLFGTGRYYEEKDLQKFLWDKVGIELLVLENGKPIQLTVVTYQSINPKPSEAHSAFPGELVVMGVHLKTGDELDDVEAALLHAGFEKKQFGRFHVRQPKMVSGSRCLGRPRGH